MNVNDRLEVITAELQRLVRGTRTDQLDNPTPCEGWVVRDLFYHLVAGEMFLKVVRGETPTEEEIRIYLSQSSPDQVDLGIADDEWTERVARGMAAAVAALRAPGALDRTITLHLGDLTGEQLAWLSCFELITHSWDLATATGRTVALPDELVAEVERWAIDSIEDDWRQPYTFGPAVTPPRSATPVERIAAFAGRAP